MRNRFSILILLFIVSLVMVGCGKQSHQRALDSGGYVTPDFEYLQSNFTCSLNDIQAHGQLRMRSDSLIWISLNKFIELGRMQLTPDSIYLFTKFNNSYFIGTYEQVAERFDYKTNYIDIQNLIVTAVQSKDSTSLIWPIRSNIINADVRLELNKIDYPEKIHFPFRIPASAKPLGQPIIQ